MAEAQLRHPDISATTPLETWRSWLPPLPNTPFSPPDSSSLIWSPLTTETFPPHPGLITAAAWAWQAAQDTRVCHPYIVTIGTLGIGKSTLVETLGQVIPSARVFPERYQEIPQLAQFYTLLRHWVETNDPNTLSRLHQVQAQVQGGFAALKFRQMLESAMLLPTQPILQDVWAPTDTAYVLAHSHLRLMHPDSFRHYAADTALRHQLLPPHVRYPVILYPVISFDQLQSRIHEVRGRDFEASMPTDYLHHHYQICTQLVSALTQLNYPVIPVDVDTQDFRPQNGGLERARQLWGQIYQLHQKKVLPRLGLT